MSSTPPGEPAPPAATPDAAPETGRGQPGSAPPARRPWSPWREALADARGTLVLVAGLAVAGVPAGVLWWALAPRAAFRITVDGPQVIGSPSEELLAADDGIYALILAGLGLLAGVVAWALRRRRGVAALVAVALGSAAAAAVAWQVGELLGPGPTKAAVNHIGSRVTTGLSLDSLPALAVGPFFAVLAYLAAVLWTRRDDLGRTTGRDDGGRPAEPGVPTLPAETLPSS